MTTANVRGTLAEFYREKLALRHRHVAGAQAVASYEFNNAYQYVIAREDVQLVWLLDALDEMGQASGDVAAPAPPERERQAEPAVIADDAREAQAFVDRWRPKVDGLDHARHRKMLSIILGETLEHKRFFDQAVAGCLDLLGRRPAGAGTGGGVLPSRWSGD